jgi:hypothetical protein
VGEIEVAHCFGNVAGFVRVEQTGSALAHRAKATMAGANIATQHECRRTIRPALKNVGATGFLTDCVQVKAFDQF